MASLLIPLPWREGSKGRGKIDALFTPTLVLPHQGGGELKMPCAEARGVSLQDTFYHMDQLRDNLTGLSLKKDVSE